MTQFIKRSTRAGLFATAFLSFAHGLLAQSSDLQVSGSAKAGGTAGGIFGLLIAIVMIVAMWKIYTKAGQPGWASIVPFYNIYILCKIVGKPGWWLVLLFIPFVNFVIIIILVAGLAKSFGKGVGYVLGMIFLPFIFYPMLAFGDASYSRPAA